MEANREEAQRCLQRGIQHWQRKEYQEALRLFTKSNNMSPTEGAKQWIRNAQSQLEREATRPSSSSPSSPQPHSTPFQNIFNRLPIDPHYRTPLKVVGILIIVLLVYRLFFGSPRNLFGQLPGDIYYQSGNNFLFAPIVSSIVFSLILNLLLRVFHQGHS